MKRLTLFSAILFTALISVGSAHAQVKQSKAEQQVDSTHAHAISITDLEMIDPENRLIPESKEEAAQQSISDHIESPLSSARPDPVAKPAGRMTAQDLQMLESIKPSEKAGDGPSR